MGILGKLFGSEKVMDAAIGGITKGFDALVYTEEEKSVDAAKERSEARSMLVEWVKNTQGQNIARRLIALIITAVWLFMYLASAILDVSVVWMEPGIREQVSRSAVAIGQRADSMTGAMMLILAFYFAAPHMDKIVGAALGKFGGK
jgi:uncharacterized membrane protein YgcG